MVDAAAVLHVMHWDDYSKKRRKASRTSTTTSTDVSTLKSFHVEGSSRDDYTSTNQLKQHDKECESLDGKMIKKAKVSAEENYNAFSFNVTSSSLVDSICTFLKPSIFTRDGTSHSNHEDEAQQD